MGEETSLGSAERAMVAPGPSWVVPDRAGSVDQLDLGARIALAADLQQAAGNAATTQLIGRARSDQLKDPPKGAKEIMDAAGGGTRGLTRTRYIANPPIFRIGQVEEHGGVWSAKPVDVNLPSLDHTVMWPAPGRHRLRPYGKGSQILEVTEAWSSRILQGEDRHVGDIDLAWDMTWGKVASVVNGMASGKACTGPTADAARAAAWRTFKGRLPAGLRPAGDVPDTAAQEARWGADDAGTVFSKLMIESQRARDDTGLHSPEQGMKQMEGLNRIDELSDGKSDIPGVTSAELISAAWKRVTGG